MNTKMRVLYRMLIKVKKKMEKKIFCLLKDLDVLGFWEMGSAGFYVPVCAGSLYHPVAHFFFSFY